MARTPDRHPGEEDEEGTVYENLAPGNDPTAVGGVRMVNGAFRMKDSVGVFDPSHLSRDSLRRLLLFMDSGPGKGFASGAYMETLPAASPFPTSWIWWVDSGKTQKIVELTITRNANQTPNVETWKMYDTDGTTVIETVVDTIAYTGIFETSRTRSIS